MARIVAVKKPGFFWQGLLIVLPAILLAGFGLLSLRQDRILAEHEATETARKLAKDLVQNYLPGALAADSISVDDVERFRAAPVRAEDDPILIYARKKEPRIACLVNAQGELLYPPPIGLLGVPQPLDLDSLSEAQQIEWEAAQKAVYIDQNLTAAAQAYEQFLDTEPPESFAANADYQLGILWQLEGNIAEARNRFERVINFYPTVAGETGLPLKTLSAFHLLQVPTDTVANPVQRSQWVTVSCADAVVHPNGWSAFLLDKIGDRGWLKVWAAHQTARALFERYRQSLAEADSREPRFSSRWLGLPGSRSCLVLPQAQGQDRWLLALTESDVSQLTSQVIQGQPLPAYLDLTVEMAGKSLITLTNNPLVLATATAGSSDTRGAPPMRVSVHLTDPDRLYARQRTRSLWFGSLIAIAAAAVLVGFVAAWRAFHRQQQLSEMKTNFVSSVSHELRAPIASVRLMAEELEDLGERDQKKNKEYHHFIVQECRRLSALIENVLDFSRHEQGRKEYEFEPTDLERLVRETAKLMHAYGAERQIAVLPTISGKPVPVELDGRAIQQVLVNLIDNAIKHSPTQGTVEVGLEFEAQRVLLWVEDHGEGIPPEDHERIFERFYRRGSELRRETQGVGLGLAIVKYVTEAHRGKISVRSAVGQGSRFTVELPITPSRDGKEQAHREVV